MAHGAAESLDGEMGPQPGLLRSAWVGTAEGQRLQVNLAFAGHFHDFLREVKT